VLAFEAEDKVCLEAEGQVCSTMMFANVVVQHGLDGLQADGILGLAPSAHTNQQNFTSTLFLDKLYAEGVIPAPVFSLMIDSDDAVDSKITIGGYDSGKFGAPGSKLVWHDLKPNEEHLFNHWRLHLDELKFGDF